MLLLEPKGVHRRHALINSSCNWDFVIQSFDGWDSKCSVCNHCILVGWSTIRCKKRRSIRYFSSLLSNYFLGDGWWTIFQAIGWASVAVIGSYANLWSNNSLDLKKTCYIAFLSAFMFDFIVSLSIIESSTSFLEFVAYLWAGIPYDLLHAVGNVTFALWFAEWFVSKLEISEVPTIEEAIIADLESTQA